MFFTCKQRRNKALPYANIKVEGEIRLFLLDTGAQSWFMSKDGLTDHKNKHDSIELVGNTATTDKADKAKVELEWKDESWRNNIYQIWTYVFWFDIPEVNILGSSFFKKHNLIIGLANK